MVSSWYGLWRPYVPVGRRQAQAARRIKWLAKSGRGVEPIEIEGRAIARTFWGKAWCENLERYSDYANRIPRGRTYVRNGSVIDLQVARGRVEALVSGSRIYQIEIGFKAVAKERWKALKESCAGRIDSVVELLQGKLSQGVMEVLTAKETGLFPAPGEINLNCSCPDYASMCKHVAAVLYGVGARLDSRPELLFALRGVDHLEILSEAAAGPALAGAGQSGMDAAEMSSLFGIEVESETPAAPASSPSVRAGNVKRGARQRGTALSPALEPARARAVRRARSNPAARSEPPDVEKEHGAYRRGADITRKRRRALRKHFERQDTLTNAEYRELFLVPYGQATRELQQLTEAMLLIREGRKRGTRYVAGVEMW